MGDIVMVKDENVSRNKWYLSCIFNVYPSEDGRVCKVQVAVADHSLDNKGLRMHPVRYLDCPVQKLVLLVPCVKSLLG